MKPILIYAVFTSQKEAEEISKNVLQKKLVSCANMFPAHISMYWWEGEIQNAEEVAVLYKTREDLFPDLEKEIKAHHSYDVPCIVGLDIERGHKPFLEWICKETNL